MTATQITTARLSNTTSVADTETRLVEIVIAHSDDLNSAWALAILSGLADWNGYDAEFLDEGYTVTDSEDVVDQMEDQFVEYLLAHLGMSGEDWVFRYETTQKRGVALTVRIDGQEVAWEDLQGVQYDLFDLAVPA